MSNLKLVVRFAAMHKGRCSVLSCRLCSYIFWHMICVSDPSVFNSLFGVLICFRFSKFHHSFYRDITYTEFIGAIKRPLHISLFAYFHLYGDLMKLQRNTYLHDMDAAKYVHYQIVLITFCTKVCSRQWNSRCFNHFSIKSTLYTWPHLLIYFWLIVVSSLEKVISSH